MRKCLLAMCLLVPFAAQAADPIVQFSVTADMPSMKDSAKKDTFLVKLSDQQIDTALTLTCNAGGSSWIIMRTDESCAVIGAGNVIKPDKSTQRRVEYSGGYIIEEDGTTESSTIVASYLPMGSVGASQEQFKGVILMKPENPSPGASELGARLLKSVAGSEETIDKRQDSVSLQRVLVPSAGLPTDKGCLWSGDMVYTYQTSSWAMSLTYDCGQGEKKLIGSMPWVDVDATQARYELNLAPPSGAAASDDALFSAPAGDDALFAAVDGIKADIAMKKSGLVDVEIEGKVEKLASKIEASATITGTNVPLPAVRSFGVLFGLLSRTFFGS